MKHEIFKQQLFIGLFSIFFFAVSITAQTNEFTYQGKLSNTGAPSATYDFEFRLCSAEKECAAPLETKQRLDVAVEGGSFSVKLDFAATNFNGDDRWLEIAVKRPAEADFTTLAPRQKITSAPYSIRSKMATAADDSVKLGGVEAAEYVTTATVGNSFIKNDTVQQTADFNISGDGTVGGTLTVNGINSATQYSLGGSPVLSANGVDNIFVGADAGLQNTDGFNNSFFGRESGRENTTGLQNSFFGRSAGIGNTTGLDNTFIGAFAGQANGAANANTFVGVSAGFNNTGNSNAFFGRSTGFQNTTGFDNSFFGAQAGRDNSTGIQNSFFGRQAGIGNTTGLDNTFVGAFAGLSNGAGNANSFFGVSAGFNNSGSANSFFGRSSGFQNTTGIDNAFFGSQSGRDNSTGIQNSFLGRAAGIGNTTGRDNTFVGAYTGQVNGAANANTFVGVSAGFNNTGSSNTFFGRSAGFQNTTGFDNSFFGTQAGRDTTVGVDNSFFGRAAGIGNFTGGKNTIIGSDANVGSGSLIYATAIGADAVVSQSYSLVLGSNNVNVGIGTSAPTAKLHVIGTTRTNLLQITGGSDLAENFEFVETVKAGMIVAIDSRNAGKLIVARGAYNSRVAGVISGANNLSAGLLLPDLNENSNSSPVALSGRVWVYADASQTPIKPGDLLTTSNTPGYAMKAVNRRRAQGAVIGKAMTNLKSGKGLVLVLVSLQ